MKLQITEDTRTFKQFYPDQTLRHKVHYAFAHSFVPQYVFQNPFAFFSYLYRQDLPGGAMEPCRFIQSRWATMFERALGLTEKFQAGDQGPVFRRVSDLSMSVQTLGGRASALIQLPPPENPTEAYFVCAVLMAPAASCSTWPRDTAARIFTLEAMMPDASMRGNGGILCEWTKTGSHQNMGLAIPAQAGPFLEALESVLAKGHDTQQNQT